MNERIRQLIVKHFGLQLYYEGQAGQIEKFAELIVQECIRTVQLKIVRNGSTPENIRSRQHVEDIAKKFGIELPMNYFGVEE